jgi:hypothetical protein
MCKSLHCTHQTHARGGGTNAHHFRPRCISVDLSHTPTTPPQPRKQLQQLCGCLSSALALAASAGHKRPLQEGELQRVANEVSLPHLPLPLLAAVNGSQSYISGGQWQPVIHQHFTTEECGGMTRQRGACAACAIASHAAACAQASLIALTDSCD